MLSPFYQQLKAFIWPRYFEKGPPSYIDSVFFDKECLDSEGRIKDPVKSVLDFMVLGYRPVTTLSILGVLVRNQNRPMYGAQLGREIEESFQLPKGWFTKTRYYDTRVGKLLKILCRLEILEEMEFIDALTKRRHVGYQIAESLYPTIRERILCFMEGGTLSIFSSPTSSQPPSEPKQTRSIKRCTKCQALTRSSRARYCEICGNPLTTICQKCGRENSPQYTYCLHCGEKLNTVI